MVARNFFQKFLIVFVVFFSFNPAFAVTEQNIPSQIQQNFEKKVKVYAPKLQQAAKSILHSLGVISLVLTFGFMAMRGELEIGSAAAQLIKFALIIGFFTWLIDSPQYLKNIYEGFDTLGTSAGNVKFDEITNRIYAMWSTIFDQSSIWEPGQSIVFGLVGIAATIAILFLVGQALMIYAFTIFSVYIGVFWLGFAGLEQTRPWAIHAISNVVRWSAKWMLMLILISISFSLVNDALINMKDITSAVTLLIVSLLTVSISTGITSFVDSYFSGMGGGENNRGMQMASTMMSGAAGAAMGAYQGAKGASDTIAAASATGQEKSTLGKATSYLGGMAGGAAKGAMHGGGNFAQNWAKSIDPNSTSSSSSSSGKNFATPTSTKEVPLGTDSGFGGVDGTIGNAMTEPKPNPNVVS